jgi:hypothetical protein
MTVPLSLITVRAAALHLISQPSNLGGSCAGAVSGPRLRRLRAHRTLADAWFKALPAHTEAVGAITPLQEAASAAAEGRLRDHPHDAGMLSD